MYARMYQLSADARQIDGAADEYRATIDRAYGSHPGFRGALLFADRSSGEMLSIALFATADALDETASRSEEEAIRGSLVAGAHEVPIGRQFEVVARVH